jgi:hypothetical protein
VLTFVASVSSFTVTELDRLVRGVLRAKAIVAAT